MWEGRFHKETNKLLEKFNASITFDKRMYEEDIAGSIAHSRMLAKQGIIAENEQKDIENGLLQIKDEIEKGEFEFRIEDEDIHMSIEKRLTQSIGPVAGKLHTARSRNDQVALDVRMYVRKEAREISNLLVKMENVLLGLAEKYKNVIIPGYTHLQRAQPILFSHHLMAYFQMFKRDISRIEDFLKRSDEMPLGSGALAGTTFNLDRHFVAEELGFSKNNITIQDGKGDQAEQTNQINNFITSGVDVMILNLVQASSAPTVTDLANKAGIPVVYINREPDAAEEERWAKENIKATYVGADARQSGTFQGEEIAELANKGDINGDGKVSYIMIQGDPENVDAQYRTQFSIEALKKAGIEVEELDSTERGEGGFGHTGK